MSIMKKIFSIHVTNSQINLILLILRFGLGTLMLVHGIPKLISLLSGQVAFPSVLGLSPEVSLALAVSAEVFCSILLLLGLGTRLAVFPLIATMLVAVFVIHTGDPFSKQELGIMYLLGYVVLMIAGSGKYSLDYLVQSRILDVKPVTTSKIISTSLATHPGRVV
jgi:putative oxidoreductase